MKKPEPEFDWGVVEQTLRDAAPRPPEGAVTIEDFMQRYEIKRNAAQVRINLLIAAGKLNKVRVGKYMYYLLGDK
jgi:hypothetical protein